MMPDKAQKADNLLKQQEMVLEKVDSHLKLLKTDGKVENSLVQTPLKETHRQQSKM
jgi:hypothetical protein